MSGLPTTLSHVHTQLIIRVRDMLFDRSLILTAWFFVEENYHAARLAVLRAEQDDMREQGIVQDDSPASFICLGIELENAQ